MKKLAILFTVIIMAVLFAVSASALEPTGQCGDNVYWSFDESTGELVISGEGEMWNFSYASSPFYTNSYANDDIKKVIIKKGVTSVGDQVFDGCYHIESVDLADSITSIGYHAFYICGTLKSIYIPKSVIEIKEGAFLWCHSLLSIIVDKDNLFYASDANGVLFDKQFKTLIQYPMGNKQTSYTIPKGVVNIGREAFISCDELRSVTIPDTVVTIGVDAFNNCDNLKNIVIPKNVATIDNCAFAYCKSMEHIIVDQNNKYFSTDDRGALFDKNKTKLIQYPCGNKNEVYSIPTGVTSISDSAVAGCHNLKSIIIPKGVIEISRYAFNNCTNLEEISIPNSVISIGYYAIGACDKLKNVNIPNSVKTIEDWAFNCNESFTSIFIPESVTYIGSGAFRACKNLTRITVDKNNSSYSSDEFGVLYNKEKTILLQYPQGNNRSTYCIPNSVININNDAFFNCKNIKNIIIPDSVTMIQSFAFKMCDSIQHIGYTGNLNSWDQINIGDWNDAIQNDKYLHLNFVYERDMVTSKVEPTCNLDGAINNNCSCGYILEVEKISKLGHNVGEFVVVKESTCSEKGEKRADCSRCDYYETKKIALKKHTNTNDDEYCDVCELYLPSLDCLCVCHAKTIGAFIYKLFSVLDNIFGTRLLEKVFNISEYCTCGLKH